MTERKGSNLKTIKSISIFFTVFLLVLCCTGFVSTAANVKLSKKQVTIVKGNKTRLKLIGTKRSIKWRVPNKKIISIKKTGKYTVIIRGKKAGTTYVTAKVGKKKYRCRIKIDGHWYYVDVTWMDDQIAESGTEKDHVPCYDMSCFLTHIPTYTDFIIDPYASGKHKNYTVKEIKKSTNTRFYKCFVDAYNACYKENKTVESLHCGSQWCYFDSPWITGSWVNY